MCGRGSLGAQGWRWELLGSHKSQGEGSLAPPEAARGWAWLSSHLRLPTSLRWLAHTSPLLEPLATVTLVQVLVVTVSLVQVLLVRSLWTRGP